MYLTNLHMNSRLQTTNQIYIRIVSFNDMTININRILLSLLDYVLLNLSCILQDALIQIWLDFMKLYISMVYLLYYQFGIQVVDLNSDCFDIFRKFTIFYWNLWYFEAIPTSISSFRSMLSNFSSLATVSYLGGGVVAAAEGRTKPGIVASVGNAIAPPDAAAACI